MLDCSQYDYDEFGCALLKPNCEYIQESGTCYLKEDPCLAGRTSTGACNRITNAEGQKLVRCATLATRLMSSVILETSVASRANPTRLRTVPSRTSVPSTPTAE